MNNNGTLAKLQYQHIAELERENRSLKGELADAREEIVALKQKFADAEHRAEQCFRAGMRLQRDDWPG